MEEDVWGVAMNFKEFISEARPSKFGPKATLINDLEREFGWKGIKWPKLPAELLETAIDEAVGHWNARTERYQGGYPYETDFALRDKAKSLTKTIDSLKSEHLNPLMARYFDAVRTIAEIGDEAEGYGRLVYNLGIVFRMLNSTAHRTDDFRNEDHAVFADAAMKKLGARQQQTHV